MTKVEREALEKLNLETIILVALFSKIRLHPKLQQGVFIALMHQIQGVPSPL